jgi:hypothetical protein
MSNFSHNKILNAVICHLISALYNLLVGSEMNKEGS